MDFPEIVVFRASAGSGKTEALSRRYVEFLLNPSVPKNGLKNIIAMTFSNNAAKEMRQRILKILKGIYFGEEGLLEHFSKATSLSKASLQKEAESKIGEILDNFSDFQVRTIDSFLLMVFRAESLNLNLSPETEFSFAEREFMRYALRKFLDESTSSDKSKELLEETIDRLLDETTKYVFDPEPLLLGEFRKLYKTSNEKLGEVCEPGTYETLKRIEGEIEDEISRFLKIVREGELRFHGKTKAHSLLSELEKRVDSSYIFDLPRSLPVNKPKGRDNLGLQFYFQAAESWKRIRDLISKYANTFASSFYEPYVSLFRGFKSLLEGIKVSEERLFIGDALKKLCLNVRDDIVPDIYLRLGERIYHFFIDEFQDTSHVQWSILLPLIENSLSLGGSLFVVGDTKQFIYEFRGGDFRIMRDLENHKFFPYYRERLRVEKLSENRRSSREVCRFVEMVFEDSKLLSESYSKALSLTGLDDVHQRPKRELQGYVEVQGIKSEDELMDFIQVKVQDLIKRGYSLRDMAILARTNDQVLMIASLLKRLGLNFVSLSSLDVRGKKIVGEILCLLNFLTDPKDDFSFSTFLLGQIMRERTKKDGFGSEIESFFLKNSDLSDRGPSYLSFRRSYPYLWERYFEDLSRNSGYLPLYDLLSFVIDKFDLFNLFPQEEASLNKILEIASQFESKYSSDVCDFLEFVFSPEAESEIFEIPLPRNKDAINLMTIHKAKGLGFPIVFVYLSEISVSKLLGSQNFLEQGDLILPLRLTKKICEANEELTRIRDELATKKLAEFLNLIYVALTRSKDELYVICFGERQDVFPLNLFAKHLGKVYGEKSYGEKSVEESCLTLRADYTPSRYSFLPKLSGDISEKRAIYGELIHEILSKIDYFDGKNVEWLKRLVELAQAKFPYDVDSEKAFSDLLGLLNDERIGPFFEKREGREVRTEVEIVDSFGSVYRIDRLIFDPQSVKIVEFKTGKEEKEHSLQVKRYKEILRSLTSREVEAYIVYTEQKKVIAV